MDVNTYKQFKLNFKKQKIAYLQSVWKQNIKILSLLDEWFYDELVLEKKVYVQSKHTVMRLLKEYSNMYPTDVPKKELTSRLMLRLMKDAVRGTVEDLGGAEHMHHKLILHTSSNFSVILKDMVCQLGNLVLCPFRLFYAEKAAMLTGLNKTAGEVVLNHSHGPLVNLRRPSSGNMFGVLEAFTSLLCTPKSINSKQFTNSNFVNPTAKELFDTLKTFLEDNCWVKTTVEYIEESGLMNKPLTEVNACYSIKKRGIIPGAYQFRESKYPCLPPAFQQSLVTFVSDYKEKMGFSLFVNKCLVGEGGTRNFPFRLCIHSTHFSMPYQTNFYNNSYFFYYKLKHIVVDSCRNELVLEVFSHQEQTVHLVYIPLMKNVEDACTVRTHRHSPDYPVYPRNAQSKNVLELGKQAFTARISSNKKLKVKNMYWRWFLYYLHQVCRLYLVKKKYFKYVKRGNKRKQNPVLNRTLVAMQPTTANEDTGLTAIRAMLTKFGLLYDDNKPSGLMKLVLLYLTPPLTDSSEIEYFQSLSLEDKRAIKEVLQRVLHKHQGIEHDDKSTRTKALMPVVAAALYMGKADIVYGTRLLSYACSLAPLSLFSKNILAALKRQNGLSFKTKLQQETLHAQQVLQNTHLKNKIIS